MYGRSTGAGRHPACGSGQASLRNCAHAPVSFLQAFFPIPLLYHRQHAVDHGLRLRREGAAALLGFRKLGFGFWSSGRGLCVRDGAGNWMLTCWICLLAMLGCWIPPGFWPHTGMCMLLGVVGWAWGYI